MKFCFTLAILLSVLFLVFAKSLAPGSIPIKCTRPHEHYACGSACQVECATLNQTCHIVNIKCTDACYCDDKYARDESGVCIPVSQCGK
nr:PREDICTED: inducible metalloproteinase inhibitor protein [Tribolium castaneum]|eukprot:XP_008201444.1 PREDICTED: inducible metalloproteinase inhibitor protein [Tribolium castaneum]